MIMYHVCFKTRSGFHRSHKSSHIKGWSRMTVDILLGEHFCVVVTARKPFWKGKDVVDDQDQWIPNFTVMMKLVMWLWEIFWNRQFMPICSQISPHFPILCGLWGQGGCPSHREPARQPVISYYYSPQSMHLTLPRSHTGLLPSLSQHTLQEVSQLSPNPKLNSNPIPHDKVVNSCNLRYQWLVHSILQSETSIIVSHGNFKTCSLLS